MFLLSYLKSWFHFLLIFLCLELLYEETEVKKKISLSLEMFPLEDKTSTLRGRSHVHVMARQFV